MRQVVELLSEDELAVASTIDQDYNQAIQSVNDFCEELSLGINVDKENIVVLQKARKLSRDEKCRWGEQR
jgi:hypothetical protein